MIVTEYYRTREDGVVLNRTYSSNGMVDWIAIQLPKLARLMAEIDQLDLMPKE